MDRGECKRILVVDDNRQMRALCSNVLLPKGYEVESASNGLEALDILRATEFDLIISDIEMPGLDGIGLYLIAAGDYPRLKERFLFITGRVSGATEMMLGRLKRKYLLKPFKTHELVKEVEGMLSRWSEKNQ
ncbi:MAG TPA: response regulator [Thermodesulfobacteriota bacterium]|nr:response regulator [Thermodesulfobacteriota bacterium]